MHISSRIPLVVLSLGACLFSAHVGAQEVRSKLEVEDPEFESIQSPEFNVNGGDRKKFNPKDWMQIEVPLKLQLRPEPASQYADDVIINWYVAVQDQDNKYLLLEKTVKYRNIPLNESVFATVFISPASLKRLTGSERADKGKVWGVAAVVTYKGGEPEISSSKSEEEWWKSPSLSKSKAFPLMAKHETPFANFWWDRYIQEIKE